VEEDVEIRDPLSGPRARLVAAYGLYCADEALSVVRHDVLNRITAVGALSYELRQVLPGLSGAGLDVARQRVDDVNRQIGMFTDLVARRLATPSDPGAGTTLQEALVVVRGLIPAPISASIPEGLRIAMGPCELQLVLLAVLSNAAESAVRGPAGVELRSAPTAPDRLLIEIDDRGTGLSEEALERCFERFYTTRPGRGGLGLSVARTLTLRAGGEIGISNRADGGRRAGARVRLDLPLARLKGGGI
jgi:signal transduction histidine kinase